jgi:hypothetical protein
MPQMMNYGEVVLGRYEVVELLCEGGQVFVAKAKDQSGAGVAIRKLKVASDERNYAQELARFKRAARLRIGHSNVLDPIDFGEEDGEWYAIYPYIEGFDLETLVIRNGGKLPVDDVVRIVRGIAAGLAACHTHRVVHRDIKPCNILIDTKGNVFIIDFGICSIIGESTVTQGNYFQGSYQWASPEQACSPRCQDPRLDLYALGGVFYYLLTGRMANPGRTEHEMMENIHRLTPPSPATIDSSIPKALDRICMQLLEKDPGRRFQCAEDLIRALDAAISSCSADACRSCGRQVNAAASYCVYCGAPYRVNEAHPRCLACGDMVEDNTPACSNGHHFGVTDHRIEFIRGSNMGMVFRAPEGGFEIGRDVLSPRDCRISHRHLRVECVNGTAFITDAGSTNGTFINGRCAKSAILLEPDAELVIAGNKAVYRRH